MAIRPEFLTLILACALVTAVPRVLPLLVLSRLRLAQWLLDWLRYVPAAVLGALLALELLNAPVVALPAVAAALAVAAFTRSLLAPVCVGVAIYWLLL
jgi:branched-subunit amino acid transport protein